MKTKQMIIWTLLVLLTLTIWGCGSSRDSSGTTTTTPGDIIAAASFVGSTQCLSCHGNKANWGHTLHKAVLRAPGTFSSAQAMTETFYAGTINAGLNWLTTNTADGSGVGSMLIYFSHDGAAWSAANTAAAGPGVDQFTATVNKVGADYFLEVTDLVGISGTKTYMVMLTYGGEGNYKQRYVVVIGNSKHISPIQYNDKGVGVDEWVHYHAERWYDPVGSELLVPGASAAFDGNCAGCHFTGYSLTRQIVTGEEMADAVDDINGALDYDGDGKMDEINIGCEACHGAGSAHASTQNPAYIINPANLTPAEGNMVCGQCHIRGKSIDRFEEFAEATVAVPVQAPFPAKLDVDGKLMKFRPGLDDLATFYSFDSGDGSGAGDFSTQYWGGQPSDGNFVTSKQHHQQYIDILQGPHAPDKPYDATCFSCHDSHDNASTGHHQVVTTIDDGGVLIKTNVDNDTLCLACHAGHGPFADITPEEVAAMDLNYPFNSIIGNVKAVVTAHTQHYFDPIDEDGSSGTHPEGAGSSRCTACHVPLTAKSALKYDIHSHTFVVIPPSSTVATESAVDANDGVPNGCGYCHETTTTAELLTLQVAFDAKFPVDPITGAPLPATNVIFDQWASSGHANYTGEPFIHWDEDGDVSTSCAKCHSKDGFIDFTMDGTVDAAAKLGTTISCGACHIDGDSPDLYNVGALTLFDDPVVYPEVANVAFPDDSVVTHSKGDASNICMNCHQGRASGDTITNATPNTVVQVPDYDSFDFINRHYFAAAAINFGSAVTAGYEYAGQTYVGEMTFPSHPATLDTCIECHLQEGTFNHAFEPDLVRCTACHTGATTFEEIGLPFGAADVDYDGNGVGESFQLEIDGLKATLLTEIQAYARVTLSAPIVYQAGAYPYFFNDTNDNGVVDPGEAIFPNRYRAFDDMLLQAAYNYHSAQDPCGDIHNYKYVIQTIYDSADVLNNGAFDGSVPGIRP